MAADGHRDGKWERWGRELDWKSLTSLVRCQIYVLSCQMKIFNNYRLAGVPGIHWLVVMNEGDCVLLSSLVKMPSSEREDAPY